MLTGSVLDRKKLQLRDPESLVDKILAAASDCCDEEPLRLRRVYWYDGAVNGIPTREQIAIGDLARVKLRLGRITGNGQKGVDGLIILDLISLARNRAVDVAVLLTGDEDLREAALQHKDSG